MEKTIGTYKTKGFSQEGVSNAEKINRVSENGAKGITSDVMKMGGAGVSKTVTKDTVKVMAAGNGVDSDKPVDSYKKQKSGSAGNVGANNVNA